MPFPLSLLAWAIQSEFRVYRIASRLCEKRHFYFFISARSLADQLEGNEEEHRKYRSMVVKHILV